jgi:hypothetical protein
MTAVYGETLLRDEPWSSGNAGWPVTASPDGRFLYVGAGLTPRLLVYAIGSDGQLSLLEGMPMTLPDNPVDILFTPDGRRAFVTMGALNERIQPCTVGVDGRPVPNGSTVPSVTVAQRTGLDVTLSATGPTTVTAPSRRTPGTSVTARAPSPRRRRDSSIRISLWPVSVSVTVTDDEGCSTKLIYTGTTASCTGGPSATASMPVNLH